MHDVTDEKIAAYELAAIADRFPPVLAGVLAHFTAVREDMAIIYRDFTLGARTTGRIDEEWKGVSEAIAGIGRAARTLSKDGSHSLDLFNKVIQINLVGTFNTIRVAAARMGRVGRDGVAVPGRSHYGVLGGSARQPLTGVCGAT